jgi:hypothetical protein
MDGRNADRLLDMVGTLNNLMVAEQLLETAKLSTLTTASFDHLVGDGEQRRRYCEAQHARGRGVDDQLELG